MATQPEHVHTPMVLDLPPTLELARTQLEHIFRLDDERLRRLVDQGELIHTLAHDISNGGVIVVDFGPVCGYVCDGRSESAIERINTLKQMESHTFALVTTPALFPYFIDPQHTPTAFRQRAENSTLPEGIHFRVPTQTSVTCGERMIQTPLDCFSIQEVDGQNIPTIQIALFGEHGSPELAYLIQTLWNVYQVPFVIATSANIHGQSELSVYRKGSELAKAACLPFLNAGPDPRAEEIAGSYGGIHVHPHTSERPLHEILTLFRHGHFDISHIRHLLTMPDILMDPEAAPPRFTYPRLESEILEWVFSKPARLRLQLLRAIVDSLDPVQK